MKFRKVDVREFEARRYFEDACRLSHAEVVPLRITKRSSRAATSASTGTTYDWAGVAMRAIIRLGTDMRDVRHVAVHEAAHVLRPRDKHSSAFYARFYALAKQLDLDMDWWYTREKSYQPRGVQQMMQEQRLNLLDFVTKS